jgi:hypothetical protein
MNVGDACQNMRGTRTHEDVCLFVHHPLFYAGGSIMSAIRNKKRKMRQQNKKMKFWDELSQTDPARYDSEMALRFASKVKEIWRRARTWNSPSVWQIVENEVMLNAKLREELALIAQRAIEIEMMDFPRMQVPCSGVMPRYIVRMVQEVMANEGDEESTGFAENLK